MSSARDDVLELLAPELTGARAASARRLITGMRLLHDELRQPGAERVAPDAELLQRELDRAWTNLHLEEHRNRELPETVPAKTPAEYAKRADEGVRRLMSFVEENQVLPVASNMEPALREHMGGFVPEGQRNFFTICMHHDPVTLYTHFYHWWDLARMRDTPHPSPVRRGPLLYNIFDSRAEGLATGVEEMFLHAGLYDDRPRSREVVWIMLAQRAARGIGSLLAHANVHESAV